MKTLADAWDWYLDAKKTLHRMTRIGRKHWSADPEKAPSWWADKPFQGVTRDTAISAAVNATDNLDDLAVLVLFSVFEANVRGVVLQEVEDEESELQHRAIRKAVKETKQRIDEGSFYTILEAYKGIDDNLITQVHQVRKYRNWVSHGKRKKKPPIVTPDVAYKRLSQCLLLIFPDIPEDWIRVKAYYTWEDQRRPGARDKVTWSKAKVELQELVRTRQIKLPPSSS